MRPTLHLLFSAIVYVGVTANYYRYRLTDNRYVFTKIIHEYTEGNRRKTLSSKRNDRNVLYALYHT